jgi:oligoribonuclease NrnB/cAMP/cGMP phosphodiesterase (DHH superfamily)
LWPNLLQQIFLSPIHHVATMGEVTGVLKAAGLPQFTRIVADSDLDGLCAAAVLKAANPGAVVHFAHAALVRSGAIDHLVDRQTAMVDLPFHPDCGWYLDHHQTNRPSEDEEAVFLANGGTCHWEAPPSAARLAYDVLKPYINLDHLEEIMPVVDALDSGQISREDFLADGPILQLARSLSMRETDHMQLLLELLSKGTLLADVLADERIRPHVQRAKIERAAAQKVVESHTTIIDRLAVCRMDEKGVRSNGYLVTAWAGDRADACCIVHGFADGSIETPERPALSASFYANSFLPNGQGRFDLSRLATALDPTGGGHANACGCRIQPPGLDSNLDVWLDMWANRHQQLAIR